MNPKERRWSSSWALKPTAHIPRLGTTLLTNLGAKIIDQLQKEDKIFSTSWMASSISQFLVESSFIAKTNLLYIFKVTLERPKLLASGTTTIATFVSTHSPAISQAVKDKDSKHVICSRRIPIHSGTIHSIVMYWCIKIKLQPSIWGRQSFMLVL